ncbi:EF-P beta-lysylation protein EpmB [Candidatus Nitrosacidococcus tergens]|uniref:L-lysine 2,3-aminomutase n=1 Tax=Candidatus Nitrosacidococcus tergens TaxID=553981 RepID=A0A7G1QBZ2_9GAMM|nr:EF-P beta-lysylation protein EpmB [Candidatus Nitrosacidococcus tergens]CAB1277060.1 putative lysine aminomutase [Candidatus Nitrosacidococcus tergens]
MIKQFLDSPQSWQITLANAIHDPKELLALMELDSYPQEISKSIERGFSLRVPHSYVARMKKGDPNDPLFLQVFPLAIEDKTDPSFSLDPVGDLTATTVPGVLQKYIGRVLLITTGACAIHCRYCFRRHFPYTEHHAVKNYWREALQYIAQDSSIKEVILSGGDPLVLSDNRLANLVQKLEDIPHVKRIRIHTRLPIVLPERINESLLYWLANTSLQRVIVIHTNHANEIDQNVVSVLRKLSDIGCYLFNQTVLLRRINDEVDTLVNLSERLFEVGVIPYYLHMLDKVQGAAHFEVDLIKAQSLYKKLRAQLPGYLVPLLVQEQAGAPNKLPLFF